MAFEVFWETLFVYSPFDKDNPISSKTFTYDSILSSYTISSLISLLKYLINSVPALKKLLFEFRINGVK